MRAQLLAVATLLAALHLAGPLVTPPAVGAGELARHAEATVRVVGTVVDVDPGSSVHRVLVQDPTGTATLLVRTPPPPLGAHLEATGQVSPEPGGAVLWVDGPPQVVQAADPEALSLATILEQAPFQAGAPVAVVGTWDPGSSALTGEAGTLPTTPRGIVPAPGEVLLWGRLVYEPARAGYVLEATGWRPWSTPT